MQGKFEELNFIFYIKLPIIILKKFKEVHMSDVIMFANGWNFIWSLFTLCTNNYKIGFFSEQAYIFHYF